MGINKFFEGSSCNLKELSEYLDGLDSATRINESTNLNSKQQQALWTAAEGGTRLTMDDFVPANKAPLEEVVHWGQNNLPVFSKFQKVMCKTSDPKGHSGYNVSSVGWLVGNGYFVVRETQEGEADNHGIVVDYTDVPSEKSEHWPDIKPCNERLGALVYAGNHDFMRKVSKHVTIGRAKKANAEKWMPNWFILCRED
jgi:hypothetical protein